MLLRRLREIMAEPVSPQTRLDHIVVLIDAAYTELAVRTLHSLYGLDRA